MHSIIPIELKKIVLPVLVSVFLLSAMLLLTKESTSFSQATIYVDPSTNDVSVGNTFVINVSVADVVDLSGFGFTLGYNTTILDASGVWVPPPFEAPPIIVDPQDDHILVTATSPVAFSGSSTLASITFKATALGSSSLDLYNATLSDSAGNSILHTIIDGSVTVSSVIITVPDDYLTIQEAINAASEGDTVFVRNGTYYENVVVNKQISLLGENSAETIVNANATGTVLNIVTSNVNLSGFTVRSSGSTSPDSGILLQGAANCRIFGNRIVENGGDGVFLIGSSNNVISENEVVGNDVDGISVSGSVNNTISDNNVTGNGWSGIGLFGYSSDNNVTSNNVVNNPEGIAVVISAQNEIRENRIVSNSNWGISIYQSVDNRIFHNFFGNSLQVSSDGSPNMWDNGYPSGGNYWSDYTGIDANGDGIGDVPYTIDANNTDRYPLMHPWSSLPIHNINTGLGYAAIQEAIDANETLDGHTILVDAGIYYENLVINKSLSLVGEDRDSTVINGNKTGNVVYITADNLTISGFTIQNGGQGIWLHHSSGNTISGNII